MTYYGFNFLWMFIYDGRAPAATDERALDFLAEFGFNFVRIPTDYRFWTRDFDYFHPDETVWAQIDAYLDACQARGLHMCLNFHRAPGYCINANHLERHNLWQDAVAQDAFVWLWEQFARRYQNVPASALSFDLLNEPPNPGQYGMTRAIHAALVRRTVAAIRAISQDRQIMPLMGVDSRKIYLLTSALGGAMAGLAACLMVLQFDIYPQVGLQFGPLTFMICVLGGLGNMVGGFLAAFVMAMFIAVGSSCLHTEWGYAVAFLFFMIAIFIRPQGLFGGKS
jgi:hypothetical protein